MHKNKLRVNQSIHSVVLSLGTSGMALMDHFTLNLNLRSRTRMTELALFSTIKMAYWHTCALSH